jgi:hypothetical protein
MIVPQSLKFPLLEYAQQGDLRFHGEIADFIEEERAPIGGFKSPHAPLECAGKFAGLIL